MILGLRGGIRPVKRKDRTRRKALAELDIVPTQLVIFLQQSTGAPATPIVEQYQRVQEGECIARATEGGVAVHASLCGKVVAVENRADAHGALRPAIVIQVEEGEVFPANPLDLGELSPDEMVRQSRELGLVEMVGDPVPVHQKIMDGRGKVDTLIINGTESEPYLTAIHRLGMERGRDLVLGAQLLARVMGVKTTIFATTGDQLPVIERLERDMRRSKINQLMGSTMKVKAIPTRYPLYHAQQVILATTGREVPPEQTAIEVGCQVFSLPTVCALGRAFLKGEPLTRVPVTVSGMAVSRPRNLWVPVGASLHNLLENCSGVEEEPSITLIGGLLRGEKVTKLRGPVEKNTTGLLCLLDTELPKQRKQETCLQCGSCIQVCPMGLCPVFIFRAVVGNQGERLVGLHPQDCIECGACATVCPSHIPLLRVMKQGKEMISVEGGGQG